MAKTTQHVETDTKPTVSRWELFWKNFKNHWHLYAIMVIPLVWLIIFQYVPMYGLTLGFRKYDAMNIFGGQWVGLEYFRKFFKMPTSMTYIWNTFALSIGSMIVGFLPPLLLAIALNEARHQWFKKTVQMVTYIPYFISTVVLVGMLMQFSDLRTGIFNQILGLFGVAPKNLMGMSSTFRPMYILSGVWQTTGYNCIIYLAALTSVSSELQEAAIIDGATQLQRIWHVDLPAIAPTIVTLLILGVGFTMSIGFEKVYLMQNDINIGVSEIISTFIYKQGLQQNNFSFSTAVGLFNSIVNLTLMVFVNFISKRITGTGLW